MKRTAGLKKRYAEDRELSFKYDMDVSSPCALTEHHVMKAYWGSGCIAPRILDFGTRWR
jgi:hypothetical protein